MQLTEKIRFLIRARPVGRPGHRHRSCPPPPPAERLGGYAAARGHSAPVTPPRSRQPRLASPRGPIRRTRCWCPRCAEKKKVPLRHCGSVPCPPGVPVERRSARRSARRGATRKPQGAGHSGQGGTYVRCEVRTALGLLPGLRADAADGCSAAAGGKLGAGWGRTRHGRGEARRVGLWANRRARQRRGRSGTRMLARMARSCLVLAPAEGPPCRHSAGACAR